MKSGGKGGIVINVASLAGNNYPSSSKSKFLASKIQVHPTDDLSLRKEGQAIYSYALHCLS